LYGGGVTFQNELFATQMQIAQKVTFC